MPEFSRKRQARAREEGVDIKQLAVAELMAWGWNSLDAMLAVGMLNESDGKAVAQHAALTYTSAKEFDVAYKKRVKQMRNGAVTDEYEKIHPTPGSTGANRGRPREDGEMRKHWQGDTPEPVSDEELLAAMWETIEKLPKNDPKRVDLLDKYDKLKRRQGIGEDDTTIHFYLPRPECDTCPYRGSHVITEPETVEKPKAENGVKEDYADTEEEEIQPEPGYSKNGKKLGRPPKRRYTKRKKKEETEVQKETPPPIPEPSKKDLNDLFKI